MRISLLFSSLLLMPGIAWADCIYTGAKRPYLECIYAEATAATAALVDVAADLTGLDLRLTAAETDLSFLDTALLTLSDGLDSLSVALDALTGRVDGLDAGLAAAEGDITQLEADLAAVEGNSGFMPVGSIVAWHKSFTNTPALPAGWMECNGQAVSDASSPYNGQTLPNLNGEARFLRGSSTSGVTQNATRVAVTVETNAGALFFDASGRNMTAYNSDFDATDALGGSQRGSIARTGLDNAPGQIYAGRVRPANMSVVWIMRVK